MKKVFFVFILFLFVCIKINAQTGIGTTTPDASAKLEVAATNKGFLPPRVTLTSVTDNTTISNPATGLLIYNTGNNVGLAAGYYYWNGNAWATIATSGGSGSFAASYLRGSKTASQSMAVNDVVTFSQVDNSMGQSISLNTSTGKITLAAGNTYRIRGAIPNFMGLRPAFMWYNETASAYIGSATNAYNPGDNAGNGAFGGMSEAIITPSVNTVISFRLLSSLSSASITTAGNVDFSTSGSYPWFDIQVISGNAPVTGQSVDYVSVNRTTLQTVNTGDNIIFNTINSGNIPYNSSNGNFTLTAGKTYRLTGSVSLDGSNAGSSEIDIAWKNAAGDILGNRALILSTNYATAAVGNGVTDIVYTPTVNTTIFLSVIYATANAKTVGNFTYANIQQIGSSAIVNPWTLAGTNTYNTTGNVGIGNNAPTQALDVTGNVRTSGNYMYSDGSSTAKKVSGYINAGSFIAFENIQVTVTASGNRGLSVAAVSTPFYCNIGATYAAYGGGNGNAAYNSYISTTASGSLFGWHFGNAGDYVTYLVNDTTNSRVYRITLSIGAGYVNNFITIERLN